MSSPSIPAAQAAPSFSADRLLLGYSTNVHRGESLRQIYRYLKAVTVPVKKRVFGKRPGGLELRLGIAAARELWRQRPREALREFLAASGLEIFSINAYPLGDFQSACVKTAAFRPPWTTGERTTATIRIARIFADLLPPGRLGTLSTLGGTYRYWGHRDAVFQKLAANFITVLRALEEIERKSGKRVVLAVEPEPDTTFERASDVIRFLENDLLPAAGRLWTEHQGNGQAVEEAVRRYFTVNLDTCHLSVLFQPPAHALEELVRAGIQVSKIHVTNAIALRDPSRFPRRYQKLREMDEPRFLHQFCGADSARRAVWRGKDLEDLPPEIVPGRHPDMQEIRTHFHVPVFLDRWGSLDTTQEETREAVLLAVRKKWCSHLVIETYTWPVLGRKEPLVDGITREFRWLLKVLATA